MNENRDMFQFGTNGRLNKQTTPLPLHMSEVLPSLFPDNSGMLYQVGQQIDYAVVKINITWSKTLSITNFMIADLRAINQDQPFNKIY